MSTTGIGIDYAGPGETCNRDADTGIRYGIIPAHHLAHWIWDEFEAQYWRGCPYCSTEHTDENEDAEDKENGWYEDNCTIYCRSCSRSFPDDQHTSDEPTAHTYDKDGLQMSIDSAGDVWVFKSPVTTRAAFCSPCAPGACHLTEPHADGAVCYAVPLDWFDDDSPCPYANHIVTEAQAIADARESAGPQ